MAYGKAAITVMFADTSDYADPRNGMNSDVVDGSV